MGHFVGRSHIPFMFMVVFGFMFGFMPGTLVTNCGWMAIACY